MVAATVWEGVMPIDDKTAQRLAAQIMAAIRRARFPREHAEEVHDEFEATVLTPMLQAAMRPAEPGTVEQMKQAQREYRRRVGEGNY